MANKQKKKEYMDDYNAKYYARNRERISEMMKETVHCKVCNIDTNKHNYPRHKKTTKHQALIEKQM